MASLLRSTCKLFGLGSTSRLPRREFFTPHSLAGQIIPKKGYASSASGGRGIRRRASPDYVVGGTMATCVGIWLYTAVARAVSNQPDEHLRTRHDRNAFEFVQQNFTVSRQNVDEGRWWTLITSTFTHILPPHLAVNMLALWNVGRPIVMFYGAPTYALLWLGAGAGGGALQIYWTDIMREAVKRKIIKKPFWIQEDRGGVGASGSIAGMIAVMAYAFPGTSTVAITVVAGSILCLEYNWLQGIGHKAHLGGMAVGAISWLLFLRRRRGW